jgi:hypothetical protein
MGGTQGFSKLNGLFDPASADSHDHSGIDGKGEKIPAANIINDATGNLPAGTVASQLAALDGRGLAWFKAETYAVGDIVYSPNLPSYAYAECIQAGSTAATEPTWPAVGSTVVDGTVTWIVRSITKVAVANGGTGASDAATSRANLGAMVAPVGGTGSNLPGEVRVTLFGSGVQPVVPAGGTWLWFTTLVFSSSALTVVGDQSYYGAGVAAGGANISTPAVGYVRTFMFWRIA